MTRLRGSLIVALLMVLGTAGNAAATTFPVTNTNASGPGSLRDAVQQANAAGGPDVVSVPPGTYPITGTGDDINATGDIDIFNDLTINGAGAGSTVFDGGHNDRIFDVLNATTALTINGATLTNGNNISGAAIRHVGAALTLNGVKMNANTAGGGGSGGAGGCIFFTPSGNASLAITDSTVTDNHAGGGGGGGSGGVLYFSSILRLTVAVTNSTITGNTAGGGGGGGSGGGFFISPGATGADLALTNSTLSSNSAGGAGGGGAGGGAYMSSTGPHNVILNGADVSNNKAGGGGAGGSGGALFNSPGSAGGLLSITSATINGNTAGGGGGGSGGAIYFSSTGTHTVVIDRSSISSNKAGTAGGSGSGGAMFNSPGSTPGSSITMTDATIDGNAAGGGGGAGGSGGGIYYSSSGPHSLIATASSISGNSAGGAGGPASGGGVFNSPSGNTGELRLTTTKIDGNAAGGGAGGSATGGGLYYSGGDQPVTIDRSSISNNTAAGGGATNGSGAGMYFSAGTAAGVMTVVNSTVSGNNVTGTAGVNGGGMSLSTGTVRFTNATVAGNVASGTPAPGGGINASGATATLKNTIVSGNSAGTGSNCFGAVSSQGHNLESADTCSLGAAGDLKNTDPLLGPFANYGGLTKMHNLTKGSPAINAGDNNGCPATDQRGGGRPQPPGGACDIGAYEYGSLADLVASMTVKPDPASAGHNLTYTIKLSNAGPSPDDASGLKLSDTLPATVPFSSVKTSQGSCSGKGPVSCSIGTLANGASATVTLVVKPKHALTGTNVASLSGDPTESNPGNNTASATTNIRVGLDALKLRPRRYKASQVDAIVDRKKRTGLSYKLSDRSKVKFSIQRPARGRKLAGQKCGAPSKKNRKGKRCKYYKTVRSFSRTSKSGTNRFKINRRLKRLKPGKYRIEAVAKGKTKALDSAAKRVSFKIVR